MRICHIVLLAFILMVAVVSCTSPVLSMTEKEKVNYLTVANSTLEELTVEELSPKSKFIISSYNKYVKLARDIERALVPDELIAAEEEVLKGEAMSDDFACGFKCAAAFNDAYKCQMFCSGRRDKNSCLMIFNDVIKCSSLVGNLARLSVDDVQSDSQEIDFDKILNYAKQAWQFIEKNKPVYNAANMFGNALPKGVTSANQLYGWKTPVSVPRRLTWKNLYGVKVVNLEYVVSFIPGGKKTTSKGTGTYLDRITIVPTDVSIAWGYTASSTVSISSITNAGTQTSPLAAAVVDIHFTVSTVMKKEVITHSYYVRADGYYKSLQ